ncbi:MAG: hypothetical protein AB1749_07980, partial [Pseudomonadota bacterium]
HSLEVRRSERQRAKGEGSHILWPLAATPLSLSDSEAPAGAQSLHSSTSPHIHMVVPIGRRVLFFQ